MKNIKPLSIIRLLIACSFALPCYKANAQGAFKERDDKPVKHTVKGRYPKYNEAGEYTYWVQGDTIYNCQIYSGQKIALADIDFNTKEIVKSDMLEEGTTANLYVITLNLKKGKKSYTCGCAMSELTGAVRSANKNVKLVERSEAMAEFEFTALHRMALQQQLDQMPADTTTLKPVVIDDNKSAMDKILEADSIKRAQNSGPAPVKNVTPSTGPSETNRSFDAHLMALIDGLKDDYKSMKGARVPDANQFETSVSLDGAVTTRVNYGSFNHVSLIASYGEYDTIEEALPVYQKVSGLVENSKRMPAMMVKQDEMIADVMRTNSWLPFGEMPDDLKGFHIIVEMIKSLKVDTKTFTTKDVYFVQLKLDK